MGGRERVFPRLSIVAEDRRQSSADREADQGVLRVAVEDRVGQGDAEEREEGDRVGGKAPCSALSGSEPGREDYGDSADHAADEKAEAESLSLGERGTPLHGDAPEDESEKNREAYRVSGTPWDLSRYGGSARHEKSCQTTGKSYSDTQPPQSDVH
jgi:hypothetical protein